MYQKILILAFVLALILGFTPLKNSSITLPEGEIVPMVEWEKEFFHRAVISKRIYHIDQDSYFVSLVDGSNQRKVAHDPLICFGVGGWSVTNTETLPTQKGTIRYVTLQKQDQTKEILYWYTDGNSHFNSKTKYRLKYLLRRATLGLAQDQPVFIVVQTLSSPHTPLSNLLESFPSLFEM